ncbi:MAG TPA: hypothetical protein VFQ45_09700, partial [Longimicrobium sp.]|nr:hypothetical protein [Longimicrobium sp.]
MAGIMGLPPTIQRHSSPPVPIAPYALITLRLTPSGEIEDVRALLESWTGVGSERTDAWAAFACDNRLVTHDDQPFCDPDFALSGKHRWVAVAVEAPTEMHLYAGLCGGVDGALPEIAAVAERAADLILVLHHRPLRRGSEKIRVRVHGTMYIRGASSGHHYHPRKSYLEIW